MNPLLADDLIRDALACACDLTHNPHCCAVAVDLYLYEQMTGQPWAAVEAQGQKEKDLLHKQRIDGIRDLGGTLLGWGVHVYAVLHATGVFLVCAWRHWTGRIPKR